MTYYIKVIIVCLSTLLIFSCGKKKDPEHWTALMYAPTEPAESTKSYYSGERYKTKEECIGAIDLELTQFIAQMFPEFGNRGPDFIDRILSEGSIEYFCAADCHGFECDQIDQVRKSD